MRLLAFLLSVLIILGAASPAPEAPRKLALVIAIGTYDPSTGWNPISSINDIKYMRAALKAQGFEDSDIDTLKNEQATKAGIVAAIDRLISRAKAGDIILFHFSGHGQQIFDDANKDETDGYDEALVPYDAKMRYSPGAYTGQNHYRDDELGEKLKQLRKVIGKDGSLLVLLDACHSGTATRGQQMSVTRGTDEKCEPTGYIPPASASRGSGSTEEGVFDDKTLLSNMVVISAASADQLNYETKDADKNGVGALSYAFSLALAQQQGPLNYKMLFEKIKTSIQSWKPFQNPQIEGNTNQQVFGGQFIPTKDIIRITKWNSDKTIEIPRGTVHAIAKGAKFSLYPVEVTDFKNTKPAATGEIGDARMVSSTGSITSEMPDKTKAYNIVFESKSFGEMNVVVKISLPEAAVAGMIKEKLQSYNYISLDKANADIAVTTYKDPKTNQQSLQVVAVNDSILWEKPWPANSSNVLSDAETDAIRDKVKEYSRAQYLRSISTPADANVFNYVQIEIIPGIIKTIGGKDTLIVAKTLQQMTNGKGDICFKEADDNAAENEGFIIRIRNLHDFPVYLSVLDIMPDNSIGVTIPDPMDDNKTAEDYKVSAKGTYTTMPIKLYPPYGKDFMKILITSQAMDLKAIQHRSTSRGAGSSFETFYNESFKDGADERSRGPKMSPVKVDEVKIVGFTYNIIRNPLTP